MIQLTSLSCSNKKQVAEIVTTQFLQQNILQFSLKCLCNYFRVITQGSNKAFFILEILSIFEDWIIIICDKKNCVIFWQRYLHTKMTSIRVTILNIYIKVDRTMLSFLLRSIRYFPPKQYSYLFLLNVHIYKPLRKKDLVI